MTRWGKVSYGGLVVNIITMQRVFIIYKKKNNMQLVTEHKKC